MKKYLVNKLILLLLLIGNSCDAYECLRNFYTDALWYTNKGLKTAHLVGDFIDTNPKILSIVKSCNQKCLTMQTYVKNASNQDLILITSGLTAATALSVYINWKIIRKVSEKIVGCDGSCKKTKQDLPASERDIIQPS
jgi:hypothetical protein